MKKILSIIATSLLWVSSLWQSGSYLTAKMAKCLRQYILDESAKGVVLASYTRI